MDNQDNSILGILALTISVLTTIVGIINHKKIKSKCCSRKFEVELDIDTTRPNSVAPSSSPVVQGQKKIASGNLSEA